jgi:PST family polysaccharide transporter
MLGMPPPHVDAGRQEQAAEHHGDSDPLAVGTGGSRAIRGGASRIIAFGLAVILSVVSSAIVYRRLGVVETGHYVTVTSLVALCAGLTDAGLSAIGVREFSTRDREGRRAFMRDLSGLRLALSTVGAAIAVLFAWVAGYGSLLTAGTAVAGVGTILVTLEDTYAIGLTAQLRIASVAFSDLLRVFVLALLVVVLALHHASLLLLFAASIPAAGCAMLVNAWLARRDVSLIPVVRTRRWRGLLGQTVTYSIATAIIAIYFRVALLLVSVIAPGRQTGYFSVSFRVMEVLVAVPAMLVGVTFPIFAHAAQDDRSRLDFAVGRVFDALWLIGVAAALALVVGAPFIIDVIAGGRFGQAHVVLEIQGVALMASFVSAVWTYTLLSLHRHRAILVVGLSALVLCGALSGALAELDGARGAAIGTSVSEITFVLLLALATYRAGVRPGISWRNIPLSLLAAGLGVATLAIPGIPDVARLVLALALYGATLIVLKVIPEEILALVQPRRRTT